MNAIEGWMLGYLVNSLWQLPLVFVAAWLAARMMRRVGPRMEHRVWVVALLLETILPACLWRLREVLEAAWRLLIRGWAAAAAGGDVHVTQSYGAATGYGFVRLSAALLAGIAVAYGCCVVYFAMRLAWGAWRTAVMQRGAVRVTLTGAAARTWANCGAAFAITEPTLAVSPMLAGPVTVGIQRAMLLVPPGFLERVDEADLDTVIAHEFAHMARHDFLKNLLYGLLSLPVAFHPVLWLTRSRVAESREMVCDALAAEALAGPERYARSLLRLAALLVQSAAPAETLHAIGIFDANLFERRLMSLTEKRVNVSGVQRMAMVVVCAAVGLGTCASALALRLEVLAPAAMQGTAQAGAKGPAKVSGGVMAGNVLQKVNPTYPPEAKEAKISGAVVLNAIIGKDGVIENLQVVSGPEKLRTSALDAVRQWTYKPYLLNGEPTEVQTTITVNYSLGNPKP